MFLWILILGSITAFLTACGIGANDVANAFATVIGAKVLTFKQVIVVATIFEFSGAVLMGSRVTDTIRKGIVDNDLFEDNPEVLMFGMLCASISTMVWLALATYLKWPVSTTHSTVAGVLGFSLVYAIDTNTVSDSIKWNKVYLIIASWLISPLLSGFFTLMIFLTNKYLAFTKENPIKRTLIIFPMMIGLTIIVNIFFIIYKGSPQLDLDEIELWKAFAIAFGIGSGLMMITYITIYLLYDRILDALAKKYDENIQRHDLEWDEMMGIQRIEGSPAGESSTDDEPRIVITDVDNADIDNEDIDNTNIDNPDLEAGLPREEENRTVRRFEHEKFKQMQQFDPKIEHMFSYLQIITSCLDSFAHGANDVANSIGPYAAIYTIYRDGAFASKSDVPIWILIGGGAGIVLGLWLFGYRIIDRVGHQLAGITPTRGFAMELGSSITVVLASRLSIPVSTTHCQVGSVTFGGLADGRKNVDLKVLGVIVLSWVLTLPAAGLLSAVLFMFGGYSPRV